MCKCKENNPCIPNQTLCAPKEQCDCPVLLSTSCVTYNGLDLECSGIESELDLNQTLQLLDAYICTAIAEINNSINLINVGTGLQIYAGIDAIGRRKIRSLITTGDLLTSVQNTDDINIGIDETELSQFVKDNQKTYSVANVGTGAKVYKDSTVVGDNTQFNFKSVIIDDQDGMGESFVRGIVENTDDITVLIKKIKSDTLTISANDEEISLDLAESAQIPALYVNNLYVPTYSEWVNAGGDLTTNPSFLYKGEGTLAKPFTDSINYTSTVAYVITPNTSIQNTLDVFVGTGTRLNPELANQQIIVQKTNTIYTFTGDFSYSSLNLLIQGHVICTTTGWLVDMDNPTYFDPTSSKITIRLDDEGILQLTDSLGFRNSGNNSSTPPAFDSGRIVYLFGDGLIYSSYNGANVLTQYIINSEGNFNDSNLHFQVKCMLRADYQGIYLAKNYARYDFYNLIQSGLYLGSVNTNLQAFRMTGGQVRFYENGSISVSSETSSRNYGITFEPIDNGTTYCTFQLNSAKVGYYCNYLFAKLNDENVEFIAFNSVGTGATTFPLGSNTTVDGLFENTGSTPWGVNFRNCVYQFTGIDFTKVDLTKGNTISSINTIGANVIETLVVYNSRVNAIVAGVPLYSAFLNRDNVGVAEGAEVNPYPLTSKWYRDIVLPA